MEDKNYYLLSDSEMDIMKEVEDITGTDYGLKGDFISVDNLLSIIYDLIYEYKGLKEEFEDYKNEEKSEPDYYDIYIDNKLCEGGER